MIKLLQGDCLELVKEIESGSVDLVLIDPPYGTVKGMKLGNKKGRGTYSWDEAIEPKALFAEINRILRKNGKAVLFGQEPYTSRLITEAHPNIPFSYRMIWEKNDFANSLIAKKAPVSYFEDILVFSKRECYEAKHPLRETMLKYVTKYGKNFIIKLFAQEGRYTSEISTRVHASYKFGFNDGMRFDLMDETLYKYLSEHIDFNETYTELKKVDTEYKQKYRSTFNLWEGNKYKSNILKYRKDYDGYHPTQKPVSLLEDLVKTFSNEGDLVVDLTMGSGSTGVACKNTYRNFVGMELDENYFNIAKERIEKHEVAE